MATFFEDFDNSVNDVLTKNYRKAGNFTVEKEFVTPLLGAAITATPAFKVNPFTPGCTVAAEYKIPEANLKIDTTVAVNNDYSVNVVPKVTYTRGIHKAVLNVKNRTPHAKYSLAHETFAVNVTADGDRNGLPLDGSIAVAATKDVDLGLAFRFDAGRSGLKSYVLSARYFQSGYSAIVSYDVLSGMNAKVVVNKHGGKFAGLISCKNFTAGFDFPCPHFLYDDRSVRLLAKVGARSSDKGCQKELSVSVVKKFCDAVTLTVSAAFVPEKCPVSIGVFGVTLSM